MGHLINPISTRLSFTSFWLSNWNDFFIKEFSYNLMLDKGLAALIDWVFVHSWFAQSLTKNGIFLSHYRIIRRGSKFRIHCFLVYNSSSLLKSSFVELITTSVGTESVELFLKKSLKTTKSSVPTQYALLNNLNKINSLSLFDRLESTINRTTTNLSSFPRRLPRKETSNRSALYLIRLKKLYVSSISSFIGNYFSAILSTLFSSFWFKLKNLTNGNRTRISVGVRFLDSFSVINPQFLARFIARRVTYGFQLQRVIKPLIKDLLTAISRKRNKIIGFRIACSGRFDRKQIASYVWQKFGPVSLNKFSSSINYGFSTAFLKYGTCGIKVWVASEHKVIRTQQTSLLCHLEVPRKLSLFSDSSKLNFSGLKKLVVVFNAFNFFDKKTTNQRFEKESLLKLNFETFLRFQLLALSWLRYENNFLRKLK